MTDFPQAAPAPDRKKRVAIIAGFAKAAENYCEHAKNACGTGLEYEPIIPGSHIDGRYDIVVDCTGIWQWFLDLHGMAPKNAKALSFPEFTTKFGLDR